MFFFFSETLLGFDTIFFTSAVPQMPERGSLPFQASIHLQNDPILQCSAGFEPVAVEFQSDIALV